MKYRPYHDTRILCDILIHERSYDWKNYIITYDVTNSGDQEDSEMYDIIIEIL